MYKVKLQTVKLASAKYEIVYLQGHILDNEHLGEYIANLLLEDERNLLLETDRVIKLEK